MSAKSSNHRTTTEKSRRQDRRDIVPGAAGIVAHGKKLLRKRLVSDFKKAKAKMKKPAAEPMILVGKLRPPRPADTNKYSPFYVNPEPVVVNPLPAPQ